MRGGLSDFLLARIEEDETDAGGRAEGDAVENLRRSTPDPHAPDFANPARVLAECEAKRRIVSLNYFGDPGDDYSLGAEVAQNDVLRLLALPYADHPDYDEEWRP